MITFHDLYNVLSAVVPLYVAMILAYSAVKYWRIFTPDQCSGINRFVALFAVPLLSFHYIASNNPFTMNFRFLAADSLAKLMVLGVLSLWVKFGRNGSMDWMITLFSLSTLPNTLVMGIPLLKAMYGDFSGDLMVQIVVFQCIIWYTLLLFLFEYRGARNLIAETLPEAAPSIVSFKVDPDVVSLDGRQPLATQAELRCDGKIHVTIRKSTASASSLISASARRSHAGGFAPSITPRPSNMTGAEIYSLPSSRNPTPRGSSFNHADFYSMLAGAGVGRGGVTNPNFISPRHSNLATSDILSAFYGGGAGTASARTSNFDYDMDLHRFYGFNPTFSRSSVSNVDHGQLIPLPGNGSRCLGNPVAENPAAKTAAGAAKQSKLSDQAKLGINESNVGVSTNSSKDPLHMFVWSSTTASPVSDAGLGHFLGSSTRTDHHQFLNNHADAAAVAGSQLICNGRTSSVDPSCKLENGHFSIQGPAGEPRDHFEEYAREDFSFGNRVMSHEEGSLHLDMNGPNLAKLGSADLAGKVPRQTNPVAMPPAGVMTKLILMMVWRKLVRNPNTYSSLLGVIWSLVSSRWGIVMPAIVSRSISILSDAGLGMAMFSLGLFMALQPKIIACGNTIAAFGMAVRFLTGPAVMAAASIAIGIRGTLLHVAIVQAALPQGIVPFVFAKEYGVHPDILSTGVIFGMLIALPITIFYYFLLGL